jgi:RNA polymerase sigma-70 factor, ECF subfamily
VGPSRTPRVLARPADAPRPGWAEEVIQDVFVRLRSNPQMYDAARGDLRRWLLTVTHHAAVDGLRSKRGTAVARDAGPEGLEFVSQRGEDPADSAWRNLQAESVRAAILDLPSAQREAMELIYFHGLTQAETAERTGQPLGTVKSRVRIGLRKLRDSLSGIEAL